jgi:hypothetical protein
VGVQTCQADLRQYRARLTTHQINFPIHPNGRSLENLQKDCDTGAGIAVIGVGGTRPHGGAYVDGKPAGVPADRGL